MNDDHLKAQDLAFEAEIRERSEDREGARALYSSAAELEIGALNALDPSSRTTFAAIGLSAATLLYKARRYTEAERTAYRCLILDIDRYFKTELRQLLDVVYDEQQLLEKGFEYTDTETEVSLLGGEVGYGTAPIDTVLEKVSGVNLLCRRVVEWSARLPFRRSGPPSADFNKLLNLRVTQPVAGSYKFKVRFAQPVEQQLFDTGYPLLPQSLPQVVGDLVRNAATGKAEAFEDIRDDYRGALLQLVRNIVPDGRDVEEVRLTSMERGRQERIDTVEILPGAKVSVNSVIKKFRPTPSRPVQEVNGVLRAVHLDGNWIEVDVKGTGLIHISTPDDALDDVVGPMINKPVIVHCDPSRRRSRMLDIELA